MIEETDYVKSVISRCKYFECTKYELNGHLELPGVEESFSSLVCIRGNAKIMLSGKTESSMEFTAGDSIFMPKSEEIYILEGDCEFILTRI